MLDQLLAWKNKDTRKPLLIDGARLLGAMLNIKGSVLALGNVLYKGPIVENFVQTELLSYGIKHTYSW